MNRQLIRCYRNKRRAPRFREIKFPSSFICKWRFGDEDRCHLSSTCRSVHLRFSWTFHCFCHFEVRSKNWLIHHWTWNQKINHEVTVEDIERNIVSLQITSQLGLKSSITHLQGVPVAPVQMESAVQLVVTGDRGWGNSEISLRSKSQTTTNSGM